MDEKDLPRVQETVLKKRKRNQEARAQQQKLNAIKAKGRRFAKKTFFKRAEKYTKENKKSQRHAVHVLREAKKPEKCVIKPRGDLAFVLRIRG
ncbi:hypothetical protein EB796_020685 [Bugula neritina]|uniref:Large ribosomal subunit protein uL30 N-terminal eukaryotes domain-containing protein n=1 Tax=Bugula neritina TaxID=10212 RepID=A0A7J7J6I3_BUGNE|nr:hypothetical protein EB796_020685 [Bugula neritina]